MSLFSLLLILSSMSLVKFERSLCLCMVQQALSKAFADSGMNPLVLTSLFQRNQSS